MDSVARVRPYLSTARRYLWLLATILVLVWGAGLAAAYVEYTTTYEGQATVWVLRASPELTANPYEPSQSTLQTAASQQAELLDQLLQTKSFLKELVDRAGLGPSIDALAAQPKGLDAIGKRFRVQTRGTNLLTVSYAAHDPHTGPEMVKAALAVRAERVAQARLAATGLASTVYQRQLETAKSQALEAQRSLDQFNNSHTGPLNGADQDQQAQLRLALDFAQVRVVDLKARIDQSVLGPALLEISGMEFQVVDEPREEAAPSGGGRPAATLAAVAFVAGSALAALLVLVGTLLSNQVSAPADVGRLAPASLYATVPLVPETKGRASRDLRAALAEVAFGDGNGRPGRGDLSAGGSDTEERGRRGVGDPRG